MKRILVAFAIALVAPAAAAQEATPLPRLTHVGVIPVQWENEPEDLLTQKVRDKLAPAFPKAVRDAKRFRVLNDQVVGDLWSSPQGRKDLVANYELNAFVSLTAKRMSDGVRLTSRLLSPTLENYLVETETMPRGEVARLTDQGLRDRVEGLVFRLFNRLPVDVIVTSVQGRYISLSGGAEQNVKAGDALQFFRSTITSRHPANESWLGFDNAFLGDARIVEVNRWSSVAQLTGLSYENAIKVGDGAKIPAIQSRSNFARAVKDASEAPVAGESAIVTPNRYPNHERKSPSLLDEVSGYQEEARAQNAPRDEGAKPNAPGKDGIPPAQPRPEDDAAKLAREGKRPAADRDAETRPRDKGDAAADNGPRRWRSPEGHGKTPDFFEPFAGMTDVVQVHGGARLWSASGAGSASSRLPFWIFNNLGIYGEKTAFSPQTKLGWGGDLGFGPTGSGSFFGFSGEVKAIFEQPVRELFEDLQFFRMGMLARYTSLNVSSEKYGGTQHMRIGLFTGVKGIYPLNGQDALDFGLEGTFFPQAFGSVKAAGKNREISNYSGFSLGASAFLIGQRRSLEWGGQVSYEVDYYRLSKRSVGTNDLYLAGAGRVRF